MDLLESISVESCCSLVRWNRLDDAKKRYVQTLFEVFRGRSCVVCYRLPDPLHSCAIPRSGWLLCNQFWSALLVLSLVRSALQIREEGMSDRRLKLRTAKVVLSAVTGFRVDLFLTLGQFAVSRLSGYRPAIRMYFVRFGTCPSAEEACSDPGATICACTKTGLWSLTKIEIK